MIEEEGIGGLVYFRLWGLKSRLWNVGMMPCLNVEGSIPGSGIGELYGETLYSE